MAVTNDPWLDQTIDGRYVVHRLIGKGGMGAVYEGEQPNLGRKVAIKFLLAKDDAHAQRFRREARHASQVVHEHLAQVYDVGRTSDGHEYIVMEYVEGIDLARLLSDEGALSVDRAVKIARAMLAGLSAIHALGIVHRDIKPSNVLLTQRGEERDFVKVGDFGLARTADDATLTKTGHIVGTTPFMSPEVFRGETLDHRADIYAVGITLYQMLAGKLPFEGATAEIGALHVWSPPPLLKEQRSDVPDWLVRIVDKALAKSRNDRFANARAFIDALDRKQVEVPQRASAPQLSKPQKPARWPWVLVALAVAVGSGVGAYLARSPGARPVATPPIDAAVVAVVVDARDEAPPPPVDAAVALTVDASVMTDVADAAVGAKTNGTKRSCVCQASDAGKPLCKRRATVKCRCQRAPDETPLCPVLPHHCLTDLPIAEMKVHGLEPADVCMSPANQRRCHALDWWEFARLGTQGGACFGYTVFLFNHGFKNVSEGERQDGTFQCDACPDGDDRAFAGTEGKPCTGYQRETAEPVAGTLRHCD